MRNGMQGYNNQSVSQSIARTKAHAHWAVHLSSAASPLGHWAFYIILSICLGFIIFGVRQISSGTQQRDSESRVEGFKYIRWGFTFFSVYVLIVSFVETGLQKGFINAGIEYTIAAVLLYVVVQIPQQMMSGFSKGMFYDWFVDEKTEQSMLQTFESFRIAPIVLLLGAIAAIVIITILFKF